MQKEASFLIIHAGAVVFGWFNHGSMVNREICSMIEPFSSWVEWWLVIIGFVDLLYMVSLVFCSQSLDMFSTRPSCYSMIT